MPTPPDELTKNGNFCSKNIARYGGGRMEVDRRGGNDRPIYVLPFEALMGQLGPRAAAWRSVIRAPDTHTQPTFHRDDDRNLPDAPPDVGYPELHVPENGLAYPAHLRLVVDLANQRLFMTPTHYEGWNDGSTARNPFFLLGGAPIPVFGGSFRELLG